MFSLDVDCRWCAPPAVGTVFRLPMGSRLFEVTRVVEYPAPVRRGEIVATHFVRYRPTGCACDDCTRGEDCQGRARAGD